MAYGARLGDGNGRELSSQKPEQPGVGQELDPVSEIDGAVTPEFIWAEAQGKAFGIFHELTQTISQSLDLEATLTSVLESVERIFPSEFLEITLWDAEAGYLLPDRLVGLHGIDHRLEKLTAQYDAAVKDKERAMLIWLGKQRLGQTDKTQSTIDQPQLKQVHITPHGNTEQSNLADTQSL